MTDAHCEVQKELILITPNIKRVEYWFQGNMYLLELCWNKESEGNRPTFQEKNNQFWIYKLHSICIRALKGISLPTNTFIKKYAIE